MTENPARTVFVAGGSGVIGARTVQQLIASGHRVTAIARSPEKAGLLESWGAAAARIDLFDPEAVVAAVDGHDAVVNVATHIPKTSKAPPCRVRGRRTTGSAPRGHATWSTPR
jgi:uncharacterized protein YbjT (DUF2867 family)